MKNIKTLILLMGTTFLFFFKPKSEVTFIDYVASL